MATMNPFQWGEGGEALSPEQVKRRRAVADAIRMKQGFVPGNGLDLLGGLAREVVANHKGNQADEAEAEGVKGRKAIISALVANPNAGMGEIAGALGNEWVASDPGSTAIVNALMSQRQQEAAWARQEAQQQAQWSREDERFGMQREWELADRQAAAEAAAAASATEAPTLKTIFDEETGREQTVQWDGTSWVPVGGVQAPKEPLVQVNTGDGQDGALNKALSTKEGESWAAYKDAGAVSASNAQDFGVLDELLSVAPQGPITGRLADAFKGFSSAGDAVNSIVKRIAPTLRAPGSGATSDIEYEGMLQSLPSLSASPEGNQMILEIMKAKAQINMQRSDIVTQYQNGELSIGDARRALSELNATPIMTPDMRKALLGVGVTDSGTAVPTDVDDILKGYGL